MMTTKTVSVTALVLATLLVAPAAFSSLIYTGTGLGNDGGYDYALSARAEFDLLGDGGPQPFQLRATLTNTSALDVGIPIEILTGFFFQLDESIILSPVSAMLSAGSTVLHAPVGGAGPDVGAEWAYRLRDDGMTEFVPPAEEGVFLTNRGVSSSGLGIFGPEHLFDPLHNLQGPLCPDGLQYGITSAGDNPNTGNAKVTGSQALIQNSVTFLFDVSSAFDLSLIQNVWFQYGTGLDDPSYPGIIYVNGDPTPTPTPPVPEPVTGILLGLSLGGLLLRGRMLRRG
jgi:hypothetical protein